MSNTSMGLREIERIARDYTPEGHYFDKFSAEFNGRFWTVEFIFVTNMYQSLYKRGTSKKKNFDDAVLSAIEMLKRGE